MVKTCEIRVGVIRKTDGMFCGSMPAMVGMVTRYNAQDGPKIERLNVKSVTYSNGDRQSRGVMVHLNEAKKFGFPHAEGCKLNTDLKSVKESR